MDRLILALSLLVCTASSATAAPGTWGGSIPTLRDQSPSITRSSSCSESGRGGGGGPIVEIRDEVPAVDPCGGCDRRWHGRFNPVREYCHENIVSGATSCRECALFLSVSYPSCGVVTDLR